MTKKSDFDLPVMDLDLDLGIADLDLGLDTFAPLDLGLGRPKAEEAIPVEKKVAEIRTSFMARTQAEAKRVELVTDTEFWCCLCFETRDQKDAFLKAANLFDIGDKYLDGRQVAKRLGIDPGAKVQWPKTRAHSQRLEKHISDK